MVVYTEITRNNAGVAYMRGVTVIDERWLYELSYGALAAARCTGVDDSARAAARAAGTPLCRNGKALDTPTPKYDAAADCVMCYVRPTFGPRMWTLPVQMVR